MGIIPHHAGHSGWWTSLWDNRFELILVFRTFATARTLCILGVAIPIKESRSMKKE